MSTIVKGRDLMVFVKSDETYKSIALATSHSLSLSTDSTTINSKDHGIWGATEVNRVNWEISTENLYSETSFDELFGLMTKADPVDVYFGLKNETAGNNSVDDGVDVDGSGTGTNKYWTPKTSHYYTGKVLITSLSANAPDGDNATFSATFTGVGAITKSE